jgi:branched-chain amino acid transport system ATP-binding protein
MSSVLALSGVTAGYGRTTVLRDIDLAVEPGTIAALLGPNGAGKTTLLKIAAGVMRPSAGTISVLGDDVTKASPAKRARKGVCLIPEGRGVFPRLTVRENLLLHTPPWQKGASTDQVLEAFPILRDKLGDRAGSMSGGQQQMLALARAYLSNPKVVLLDEVSMGLAPKVVDEIFETLQQLASTGVTLLLVEQFVTRALAMSDTVHLLNRGRLAFSGPPGELDEDEVLKGYLGADLASAAAPASAVPSPGTSPALGETREHHA